MFLFIMISQTQQRLSVAYTLLLSQIAFRWTISVSHLLVCSVFLLGIFVVLNIVFFLFVASCVLSDKYGQIFCFIDSCSCHTWCLACYYRFTHLHLLPKSTDHNRYILALDWSIYIFCSWIFVHCYAFGIYHLLFSWSIPIPT